MITAARKTTAVLCALIAVLCGTAAAQEAAVSSNQMLVIGYVKVLRPQVPIEIDNPGVTFVTGVHLPLFQENEDYYVALIETESRGRRLCAFPLRTGDSRSGWVDKENQLIFAYATDSCSGRFYLSDGEVLPVVRETAGDYEVVIERFGRRVKALLPKSRRDIQFAQVQFPAAKVAPRQTPPPTPAPKPAPVAKPAPKPLPPPGTPAAVGSNAPPKAPPLPAAEGSGPGIPVLTVTLLLIVVVIGEVFLNRRRKARAAAKGGGAAIPDGMSGEEGGRDFSGSVTAISLTAVTQFLNSNHESGTLTVKDPNGVEVGTLVFVNGDIVDATAQNKRGTDAARESLQRTKGSFAFVRGTQPNLQPTITESTIALLLNANQQIDEESTSLTSPSRMRMAKKKPGKTSSDTQAPR